MARIRSIHPAIWTDEDFAALSMGARVLFFGIWTEADDHGVFEWKPVGLKMRILPADKVAIEPLLEELVTFKKVAKFTNDGREYGAVRNFCKFQRPKKPSIKFLLPDQFRTYVGLTAPSSEPEPHETALGTEKSPQMKEEGGRREEERKEDSPAVAGTTSEVLYAFESGVIRLKQKDFDQWKLAFSHLDLAAELVGLAAWAATEKRWFQAVSGALAKKNRELGLRIEQGKTTPEFKWKSGIEGVV